MACTARRGSNTSGGILADTAEDSVFHNIVCVSSNPINNICSVSFS